MQSVSVEHLALDYDPGDADAVENVPGKPYAILLAKDEIDASILVGNKSQRTARGCAQLRAKSMIVTMSAIAQVTIDVGELTAESYLLSAHELPREQVNVSLLRHFLRSCQVRNHGLNFREWHAVEPMPISELKGAQTQRRGRGE